MSKRYSIASSLNPDSMNGLVSQELHSASPVRESVIAPKKSKVPRRGGVELPGWKLTREDRSIELPLEIQKPYYVSHRSELNSQPKYPDSPILPSIVNTPNRQKSPVSPNMNLKYVLQPTMHVLEYTSTMTYSKSDSTFLNHVVGTTSSGIKAPLPFLYPSPGSKEPNYFNSGKAETSKHEIYRDIHENNLPRTAPLKKEKYSKGRTLLDKYIAALIRGKITNHEEPEDVVKPETSCPEVHQSLNQDTFQPTTSASLYQSLGSSNCFTYRGENNGNPEKVNIKPVYSDLIKPEVETRDKGQRNQVRHSDYSHAEMDSLDCGKALNNANVSEVEASEENSFISSLSQTFKHNRNHSGSKKVVYNSLFKSSEEDEKKGNSKQNVNQEARKDPGYRFQDSREMNFSSPSKNFSSPSKKFSSPSKNFSSPSKNSEEESVPFYETQKFGSKNFVQKAGNATNKNWNNMRDSSRIEHDASGEGHLYKKRQSIILSKSNKESSKRSAEIQQNQDDQQAYDDVHYESKHDDNEIPQPFERYESLRAPKNAEKYEDYKVPRVSDKHEEYRVPEKVGDQMVHRNLDKNDKRKNPKNIEKLMEYDTPQQFETFNDHEQLKPREYHKHKGIDDSHRRIDSHKQNKNNRYQNNIIAEEKLQRKASKEVYKPNNSYEVDRFDVSFVEDGMNDEIFSKSQRYFHENLEDSDNGSKSNTSVKVTIRNKAFLESPENTNKNSNTAEGNDREIDPDLQNIQLTDRKISNKVIKEDNVKPKTEDSKNANGSKAPAKESYAKRGNSNEKTNKKTLVVKISTQNAGKEPRDKSVGKPAETKTSHTNSRTNGKREPKRHPRRKSGKTRKRTNNETKIVEEQAEGVEEIISEQPQQVSNEKTEGDSKPDTARKSSKNSTKTFKNQERKSEKIGTNLGEDVNKSISEKLIEKINPKSLLYRKHTDSNEQKPNRPVPRKQSKISRHSTPESRRSETPKFSHKERPPRQKPDSPFRRFLDNFSESIVKTISVLLVETKIKAQKIPPSKAKQIYKRMAAYNIIKGPSEETAKMQRVPSYKRDHRYVAQRSIEHNRKPSLKRKPKKEYEEEEEEPSNYGYNKTNTLRKYEHYKSTISYELKHMNLASKAAKDNMSSDNNSILSDEESYSRLPDIQRELYDMFKGKSTMIRPMTINANFQFRLPQYVDLRNTNLDPNDEVPSYIDKDNFDAVMIKKRFKELKKFVPSYEENSQEQKGQLFMVKEKELHPEEQRVKRKNDLEKRVMKQRIIRSRGNVPIVTLRGKPVVTFTNLPCNRPSQSQKNIRVRKPFAVSKNQSKEERVYCHLKHTPFLTEIKDKPQLCSSLEENFREFDRVNKLRYKL